MKENTRAESISARTRREDGNATKAKIIDIAGRLFAERGYANTTSKDICQAAGVNQAAVNYHFSSRENLYLEALKEMHDFFTSPALLAELESGPQPAREKISLLLDRFIEVARSNDSWQLQLWARETIAPTDVALDRLRTFRIPNFDLLHRLLSEMTGIPLEDALLDVCFFYVMSPFKILTLMRSPGGLVSDNDRLMRLKGHADDLKELLFLGLDAFARQYAERRAAGPGK